MRDLLHAGHLDGDATTLALVLVGLVSGENFSTLEGNSHRRRQHQTQEFCELKAAQKPQAFPKTPRLKCCTNYVGVACPQFCSCWWRANAKVVKPGRLAALTQ